MKRSFFVLSSLVLITLGGCKSQQSEPPVVVKPEAPIVVAPIEKPVEVPSSAVLTIDKDCKPKTWSSEWDKIILDSLSSKPSLKNLNNNPKFYVAFIKALAKAESCLNLSERYVETGLGKDAVTGTQNTSEGLLQLSYQDAKYHGCAFDWSKDKSLGVKDLKKTIFDPKNNLECGMIILEKQVKTYGILTTKSTPYYWAVLNRSNKRFAEFEKYFKAEGFSL